MKTSQMVFTKKKIKHLLRICTWLKATYYGDLWESSLGKGGKGLHWTSFRRSCIKRGRLSTSMVTVDRGLCLTNEQCDRHKACLLLVKVEHFEQRMWCWLWYEQQWLGLLKYSLISLITLASFLTLIFHKEGNVATHMRWGGIASSSLQIFSAEREVKRILKIGRHFDEVMTKKLCVLFCGQYKYLYHWNELS